MEEDQTNQGQQITNNRSNSLLYAGIAVVVIAVVAGIFVMASRDCADRTDSAVLSEMQSQTADNSSGTSMMVDEQVTQDGTAEISGLVEINMEAGSFYYNPEEIRVKQGDTVRITLTAADMQHDFNIDELNVDGDIVKAGESTVIEFVADQVGEFEYYCSVANHRQMGQVGKLIVE